MYHGAWDIVRTLTISIKSCTGTTAIPMIKAVNIYSLTVSYLFLMIPLQPSYRASFL